jgi:5-methylcytosine-specific restriction protein A
MAQPRWSNDELILALDVYVREGRQNKTSPHVRELEELMRALPRLPQNDDSPRSAAAIAMMHSNFASLDPTFSSKGLSGIGEAARTMFERYFGNQAELEAAATAIREYIAAGLVPDVGEDEPDWSGQEGESLVRIHRFRERDRSLVAKRKSAMTKSLGQLECEVCGCTEDQFAKRYGIPNGDIFECHHVRPLSSSAGTVTTRVSDLAVVCPTCHRAIHRRSPLPSVAELNSRLKANDSPD